MKQLLVCILAVPLLGLGLLACDRQLPAPATPPSATSATSATAASPKVDAPFSDVAETTPDYVLGISYPPSAAKYPALAAQLKAYADAARVELMQEVKGRGPLAEGAVPYDLSINFTDTLVSPMLVVVAADGSSYTGGAHGNPLLARFVWLPPQGRMLTAGELVPDANSWGPIAANVREQLHAALSQRVDADALPAGERVELVKGAGRMIQDGTEPLLENYAMFEPVVAPSGKWRALRFVFAPYQVGPYSDGTQTVDVPATVLLPHIAPQYRDQFEGGPG